MAHACKTNPDPETRQDAEWRGRGVDQPKSMIMKKKSNWNGSFALFKVREIAIAILIIIAAAALCAWLSGCSSTTLATRPDGTMIYNDGSLASNADFEETITTLPNGARIQKRTWKKDQQGFLKAYLQWTNAPALIDSTSSAATKVVDAVTK